MRAVALLLLSVVAVFAGQRGPIEPDPYARYVAPVLASDVPLIGLAAFKGDVPTLHYLISSGANIESAGRDGRAPLLLASAGGHVEAVTRSLCIRLRRFVYSSKSRSASILFHDSLQSAHTVRQSAADWCCLAHCWGGPFHRFVHP